MIAQDRAGRNSVQVPELVNIHATGHLKAHKATRPQKRVPLVSPPREGRLLPKCSYKNRTWHERDPNSWDIWWDRTEYQ